LRTQRAVFATATKGLYEKPLRAPSYGLKEQNGDVMRGRRWVAVAALVMSCAAAVWADGVEIDGTVEIGAELLPTLETFAEFDVTICGEMWEVESEAEISLTPSFGGSEDLEAELDVGFAKLKLDTEIDLDPFELEAVDAYADVDLLKWEILEEDPKVELTSDLLIGAVLEEAVSPYVGLETCFEVEDHTLMNTATLGLISFDIASELETDLDFGRFELGETGVAVEVYGDVSADLIPFDFSRARLNVKLLMAEWSILNRVTYYGSGEFKGRVKLKFELNAVEVAVWGEYTSASSARLDVGISLSFPWSL